MSMRNGLGAVRCQTVATRERCARRTVANLGYMKRLQQDPDPNDVTATAVWAHHERGPVRRYKGHGQGPMKAPRCVACFPRSVAGQMIPFRYGVAVALCDDHRDPAFVHSRGGRDFYSALATTYESLGLRGQRYSNAIRSFVNDVLAMGQPTPRHRPGSYAWPEQRRGAEAAWAAGGTYHAGEAVVLASFAGLPPSVKPPSPHTIRRWWRERRWLTPRPSPPTRTKVELADRRGTMHLDRRERHPALVGSRLPGPAAPPGAAN